MEDSFVHRFCPEICDCAKIAGWQRSNDDNFKTVCDNQMLLIPVHTFNIMITKYAHKILHFFLDQNCQLANWLYTYSCLALPTSQYEANPPTAAALRH